MRLQLLEGRQYSCAIDLAQVSDSESSPSSGTWSCKSIDGPGQDAVGVFPQAPSLEEYGHVMTT